MTYNLTGNPTWKYIIRGEDEILANEIQAWCDENDIENRKFYLGNDIEISGRVKDDIEMLLLKLRLAS